ncbi:unnamed protein product, partial [Rotaria magnacalcarata]
IDMADAQSDLDPLMILWFDTSAYNDENKNIQENLNTKFGNVWIFTDPDECGRHIQRPSTGELVLLVSGG